jgi:N-formylglutamate amidohydrolase
MDLSPALAPFRVILPDVAGAVVLASAHSGRHYPETLLSSSRLDATSLRRSEDAFVDQLLAPAASLGMTVIEATFARAYLDVNRDCRELDPALFSGTPLKGGKQSDRVLAGLGVVPRVVGIGMDIYSSKIPLEEAQQRIATIHAPYHAMLEKLLAARLAFHAYAVLIDWHSMPSGAVADKGRSAPDVVLGDRHGLSCSAQLTRRVRTAFEAHGLRVAVNEPYAGGHTTERYGRPETGLHTLQIELNRGLYLDEVRVEKTVGFAKLQLTISAILAELADAVQFMNLAQNPPYQMPLAAE